MAEVIRDDFKLEGIKLFKQGKVREVYDLDDKLLFVASDRISAFDYVLPTGIPIKGKVLTQLSSFWFEYTKSIIENHYITSDFSKYPDSLLKWKDILEGRSMLVKKTKPLPVECVVRGYLAGSGWKSYLENGGVCGIKLDSGYIESDKLKEPIFTPATKADSGHDENIDYEKFSSIIGSDNAKKIRDISLRLYNKAHDYAQQKGVIIADTKFEFGLINEKIILIDEILTPDSSRFWPKDQYNPGGSQHSFDKQYVRDYLERINWDKKPPVPELPEDVVRNTKEKYLEAYSILTGNTLKA